MRAVVITFGNGHPQPRMQTHAAEPMNVHLGHTNIESGRKSTYYVHHSMVL